MTQNHQLSGYISEQHAETERLCGKWETPDISHKSSRVWSDVNWSCYQMEVFIRLPSSPAQNSWVICFWWTWGLVRMILLRRPQVKTRVIKQNVSISVFVLQVVHLLQSLHGHPQRNGAAGLVQRLLHVLLRHPAAVHRSGRKPWGDVYNSTCVCWLKTQEYFCIDSSGLSLTFCCFRHTTVQRVATATTRIN